ncbi:MAG TPA: cytochrome c peroxidase [Gemmatimonadaceae bacterium]|nr:cytochrome c peroxidase [Gemmatimonadaceae bacterium]
MPTAPAPTRAAVALLLLAAIACGDEPSAPRVPLSQSAAATGTGSLAAQVRLLAASRGVGPLPAPPRVRPALSRLGQMLAFDPILSGNRDIACMTCHHPTLATADGLSLSIGQGGSGLGATRVHPTGAFIPRNAPAAFNLQALKTLFWDGRVEGDAAHGFRTPAGAALTPAMNAVFEFGALSAQPMFPVLSRSEMRGDVGSPNELAAIDDADPQAIWAALMARLGKIPEYRTMFEAAYPGTRFPQMTFAHASNAIAGFLLDRLSFAHSPWDHFLAGDDDALTQQQLEGARDFMSLKCSICHGGTAFTDNEFHNVAVAQIGPGEGDGTGGADDFGRFRVTGRARDKYAFRTPPLRNVELTAPYGHDGSIVSLRDFIAHYSESDIKLHAYDPAQLDPRLRATLQANADAILATRDTLLNGVVLSDSLVDRLTAYMTALTDPAARHLDGLIPGRVPSGLPVPRR